MNNRIKTLSVLVAFIVCSGVFNAQAQDPSPDQIFLQGKSQPELGRVVNETMNHLVWRPKSPAGDSYMDKEELSWRKIRGIRFGDQPERFLNARKYFRNGESLDKALKLLDDIIQKKDVNRPFFINRAQYLKADILYKKSSSEEGYRKALNAYNTAIEQSPDSKGFYNAVQRKIELHRKLGETKKALEAADLLVEKNPHSVGATYGAFMKGNIMEEREKFEEAVTHYRTAMNKAGSSGQKGLQLKARARLGNSLLQSEQYSNARREFKKIIDQKEKIPKNLRNKFLLAAENGFGKTMYYLDYKEDAENKKVRKKNVGVLKDALLYFMKGVVWYNPPKTGSKVEYQRSLYWVAKSFSELAKNVSDEDRTEKYKREARKALNTLFNRYPETVFREQARRLQRAL